MDLTLIPFQDHSNALGNHLTNSNEMEMQIQTISSDHMNQSPKLPKHSSKYISSILHINLTTSIKFSKKLLHAFQLRLY